MPKVTDFRCVDDAGRPVRCDAHGNNAALNFPECGHAILAVLHDGNQRGAKESNPAECRNCGLRVWVQVSLPEETLSVHVISTSLVAGINSTAQTRSKLRA